MGASLLASADSRSSVAEMISSVISVPSQITAITLIPLELLPLQLYVLPFSGSTSVPPCRNGRRGIMHPWCEFEEQICGVDCLAGEIHLHGRDRGVPRRR